eukprot:TRINITY_DN20675_c0_g1_i2.p1 TRINITY_DN20675_c0_g1~~TRINITY_DN20675_c0_g1_i2.p1  ORF type:complete len:189 (-),score=35.84 TRINITY_DN20675_c0_g1_i2:50-616(-)
MLLDSGTSFITTPSLLFADFLRSLLPASARQRCGDMASSPITCPCSVAESMRSMEVVVNAETFEVVPKQLLIPFSVENGEWMCVLQVMPADGQGFIILGDTFLRGVLALFDAETLRIGVARRPDSAIPELPHLAWIDAHRELLRGLAVFMLCISVGLLLWPYIEQPILRLREGQGVVQPEEAPYTRAP